VAVLVFLPILVAPCAVEIIGAISMYLLFTTIVYHGIHCQKKDHVNVQKDSDPRIDATF
jgi:hypothetical protein